MPYAYIKQNLLYYSPPSHCDNLFCTGPARFGSFPFPPPSCLGAVSALRLFLKVSAQPTLYLLFPPYSMCDFHGNLAFLPAHCSVVGVFVVFCVVFCVSLVAHLVRGNWATGLVFWWAVFVVMVKTGLQSLPSMFVQACGPPLAQLCVLCFEYMPWNGKIQLVLNGYFLVTEIFSWIMDFFPITLFLVSVSVSSTLAFGGFVASIEHSVWMAANVVFWRLGSFP